MTNRVESKPHVHYEHVRGSFHVTWTERWDVGPGHAYLFELICERCGRVIQSPSFVRGLDGRNLLSEDTCEEARVREVMES